MTAETVQPAPEILSETVPTSPKRRGRPPGSKNSTTSSSRRGRPRKSMADRIGGVLTMANFMFMFAPEQYRGDALDMVEISALAKTIDDAARENPTLYKYLDTALGGTGSAMLNMAAVIGAIAARRLIRHDILGGPEWDIRLGSFVALQAGNISTDGVDFDALFASMSTPSDHENTAAT